METRDKLNAVLRLRLFFSTERELSELIGYKLKGNNFYHFKDFQVEAYFSMFDKESLLYVKGSDDLSTMLCQYEATSEFFKRYVKRTRYERTKTFIPMLLDLICHAEQSCKREQSGACPSCAERSRLKTCQTDADNTKDIQLCNLYAENNKDGELNIGILLLLTYGLIPTFTHKGQDVADIIGDFQKAYDILTEVAESHKKKAVAVYNEMLCLQELKRLIDEDRQGDKFLNRLLLIHIVNDALNRIFALERPDMLKLYSREYETMDLKLARLWRCDSETDNVVWEFENINFGHHYLYRKEIINGDKTIRVTRYQLHFRDAGYKDFCYTIIMRPSYIYNNVLRREQSEDSITFDYTDIEYGKDKKTVKQLSFTINSPLGSSPLTLKPVEKEDALRYYEAVIGHKGVGEGFTDIDNHPEYAVDMYTLNVAVADRFLLFNLSGELYKMDKLDEDGNETVAGISALTHYDNYVYAELKDDGKTRRFLCLDSINQNLDMDKLCGKPYFKKVTNVSDVFSS